MKCGICGLEGAKKIRVTVPEALQNKDLSKPMSKDYVFIMVVCSEKVYRGRRVSIHAYDLEED